MASSTGRWAKCPLCDKILLCRAIIVLPQETLTVQGRCDDCKHDEIVNYRITEEFEPFIQKLRKKQ